MSELKTILTCVKCGKTIRNPRKPIKTCPKCGGTLVPKTIKVKVEKPCQKKPTNP
jgi:rRNA maturation endonuclease Nob1